MNGGVDISWWLVALIAFGGIMGLVSFVLKLREWGVYPFQDLTRLFRRPWMEVVLVLSCVCGLVHYGATKGTNGLEGDNDGITTCFLVLG